MRDCIDTTFNPENPHMYGIDPTGPLPQNETTTVSVPEVVVPLQGEQLDGFLASIDTESMFNDQFILLPHQETITDLANLLIDAYNYTVCVFELTHILCLLVLIFSYMSFQFCI